MSLMSFIQAETTIDGEAEFLTGSETLPRGFGERANFAEH